MKEDTLAKSWASFFIGFLTFWFRLLVVFVLPHRILYIVRTLSCIMHFRFDLEYVSSQ